MFTQPELLIVLRNTALWVILVPFLATAIGLLYAILIDRARGEAFAKALIFLPMAISMVGAGIIWKFVYQYKQTERPQIGLLNQILKSLGFETRQFLLDAPLNTIMLIIVMVWIQAGFAMTILSAAIKAIPDDIIEAARLDGVSGLQDVPAHHPAEHPGRPRRRPHDDRHRHAQGLRHRPDHDRRASSTPRSSPTSSTTRASATTPPVWVPRWPCCSSSSSSRSSSTTSSRCARRPEP